MVISNSALWKPMGTVIFFGTPLTMVFTLTVIPVMMWKFSGKTKLDPPYGAPTPDFGNSPAPTFYTGSDTGAVAGMPQTAAHRQLRPATKQTKQMRQPRNDSYDYETSVNNTYSNAGAARRHRAEQ